MKNYEKGVNKWYVMGVIGLLMIIGISLVGYYESQVGFYQDLVKMTSQTFSGDNELGDEYYNIAMLSYERGEYSETEKNCLLARKYYTNHIQELKAEQSKITRDDKVFNIYKNVLDESIKIYENTYEACEWFESASRHYEYYYLVTTPYDDMSFEQASSAIDEMNKKIDARDNAVREHNSLLEDFKLEMERYY